MGGGGADAPMARKLRSCGSRRQAVCSGGRSFGELLPQLGGAVRSRDERVGGGCTVDDRTILSWHHRGVGFSGGWRAKRTQRLRKKGWSEQSRPCRAVRLGQKRLGGGGADGDSADLSPRCLAVAGHTAHCGFHGLFSFTEKSEYIHNMSAVTATTKMNAHRRQTK